MVDDVVAGSAAELATLYPAAVTVTVAGRVIQIKQPTLRQVAHYEQCATALWALGPEAFADDAVLMEEHPAEADAMLLAVMDLDPQWLASLHALRKSELLSIWMETNGPFLKDRTEQRLRLNRAAAAMFGTGPTSSSDSAKPELLIPKTTPSAPPSSSKKPSIAKSDAATASA